MNNLHIDKDGTKRWYNQKCQFHREDGPAIEWPNGTKAWYQHGQCHREDGPAIEFANGGKKWYQHGKLHREDGPAIERPNGPNQWFIENQKIDFEFYSYEEFERKTKLKAFW